MNQAPYLVGLCALCLAAGVIWALYGVCQARAERCWLANPTTTPAPAGRPTGRHRRPSARHGGTR